MTKPFLLALTVSSLALFATAGEINHLPGPAPSESPSSSAKKNEDSVLEPILIKENDDVKKGRLIDMSTIEHRQAHDLKEAVKDLPDVIVGGGQKSAQKVYVRGVEDTQLNVTVDGARQSGYLFHHQGRLSVDTELMKKIEIDAGTGDSLSGPGALGGTIRFETKDPRDLLLPQQRFGVLTKIRYSTNADEKGISLGFFGAPTSSTEYLFYGNFTDMGNYHSGGGAVVGQTAGKPKSGLGKIVVMPTDDQKISLSINAREDNARRSLRNHFGDLPFNPPNEQTFGNETYSLQYQLNRNDWLNLKANLYTSDTRMSQDPGTGRSKANARNDGLDLQNKTLLGQFTSLTYGTDYSLQNSYSSRPARKESESSKVLGIYLQGSHQMNSSLSLSSGLRFDNYELKDVIDNNLVHHHISPHFRLKYQLSENWSAFTSWTQAFKGATPMEAYVMSAVTSVTPVTNLKGTIADTYEIGTGYNMSSSQVKITAYDTVMRNLITATVSRSTGVMTRTNAKEDVRFQGYNLNYNFKAMNWLLSAGYSHNKATFGSEPLGYASFDKGNSFGDRLIASIDYWLTEAEVLLSWNSTLTMKLTEVPAGSLQQPGYDLHDFSASWTPTLRWNVNFAVTNIFDKKYVAQGTPYQAQGQVNPVYEPGRDFRFTFGYKF